MLKKHLRPLDKSVMIGDSVSDLHCQKYADLFIGFGGVETRPSVRQQANAYTKNKNILAILPFILSKSEMKAWQRVNPAIANQIASLTTTTNTDKVP